MSKLSAFLNPVTTRRVEELVISDRFVKRDDKGKPILDENGNMIPETFKIQSLFQEESENIAKLSRKTKKVNGKQQESMDATEFSRRMVLAATVEPDFSSTELCESLGVMDPLLVPGKLLLSGEFNKLVSAITELSGFDALELEETAKN